MTQAVHFELTIRDDPYEASTYGGSYATRELALQARDFLLANWPDSTSGDRPTQESCYIRELPVHSALPEFQLFQAQISISDPADRQVHRLHRPTLGQQEPIWHLLEDGARFVRNPMSLVGATGVTPEQAMARAEVVLAEALKRGAANRLLECNALSKQADALALERGARDGIEPEHFEYWSMRDRILDELALTLFGEPA